MKTTCGGLRSPDRAVTDSLQIGEVYDFDVIDRTVVGLTATLITAARPTR